MTNTENIIEDRHTHYEDLLREKLVNNILITWVIFGSLAFILTSFRAMEIGWSGRDLIYLIVLISITTMACFRRYISVEQKVAFIIFTKLSIGIIGTYTLGLFAGSIFYFPLVAVIIALFYSKRIIIAFVIPSLAFLLFVGIGFSSNYLNADLKIELLLRNHIHWAIYILTFAYFLLITSMTILNYREAIIQLLDNVNSQKNKIEESNQYLTSALNEIKTLKGTIPICSYCHSIRDDDGIWNKLEVYLSKNTNARLSHGICEECVPKVRAEVGLPEKPENHN
ncbi:MAG: hypothetical protein ACI9N9_001603 [Enterobacterales bacterium]|jgi:hypothetical protein